MADGLLESELGEMNNDLQIFSGTFFAFVIRVGASYRFSYVVRRLTAQRCKIVKRQALALVVDLVRPHANHLKLSTDAGTSS